MQLAGIAVGMIAFFTYPVITVFLEPFFHGSKPQLKDIFSALVVMLGIYLLIPDADGGLGNDVTLGIAIGILSALFFAFRNIVHKRVALASMAAHKHMLYQTWIACIMLCAFVEVPPLQVDTINWLLLITVGVIFTAAPHSLFAASL